VASKSKKAVQAVRYFLTVYYYKEGDRGLLGRFFHRNLFGKRPTIDWLKSAIKEKAKCEADIVACVCVSKEEYEYQQTNVV